MLDLRIPQLMPAFESHPIGIESEIFRGAPQE
jgi:hypothetical protein